MLDAIARASRGRARGRAPGRDAHRRSRRDRASSRSPAESRRSRPCSFEVLRPVLPMLAGSSESVAAALEATGLASVEWKLDGARVQVHRSGTEVRIFTRNLNDVTARLPEVVALVRAFPSDGVRARRRDDRYRGRRSPESVPGHDEPLRSRPDRGRARTARVLLRLPARRRRRPARRTVVGATRGARRASLRAGSCRRSSPTIAEAADAFLAEALEAGHEGVMVKALSSTVRGRSARRVVAQGEAGAHARPRGDRRGVGPRPSPRLAVEPAPRRAESARSGRLRDGRQDLQGPHRRAAHVADGAAAGARDRPTTATWCSCAPSSSSRSRSTACRRRSAIRAASRCASRVCAATAPTSHPPTPTPSTPSARSPAVVVGEPVVQR